MRTIHKYALKDPMPYNMSLTKIKYPVLKFLSCGVQGSGQERLKVWAEVFSEPSPDHEHQEMSNRIVLVAGTGANLELVHPARKEFIGTINDDNLVWHVFNLHGDQKILSRIYSDFESKTAALTR